MSAYVITKAIWEAVQKTAITDNQVSGLISDAKYVVVDCDPGSEFQTLAALVTPTIKITQTPSVAGLKELVVGTTAADVITAWTGRPLATVSDGSTPQYAHVVLIDGVAVTKLVAPGSLEIATTISAAGAQDVVVVTEAVSVAAKVADPVAPTNPSVPETGPYTLAQVEALRTDGTTRGVTIGTTFKKPGVDLLPSGLTRSGTRLTVAASADIALIDGWDFTGHDWIVRGRVRAFTNCVFGYPIDLALTLFDLYPESHIEKFFRCSFLGAGYYGNITTKPAMRTRLATASIDGPQVDLIERCDFFGWGSDVIKMSWGGAIRLCYFDTPMNLPAGTLPWSSTRNYSVGQWVTSADKKYAYRALVAGTNNPLPSAKNSNANWKNEDPHVDHINPYYQFDEKLLIEACYINRLEATRAIDPGTHRVIGINNGIRATRDTADKRLGLIEIANVIISKSEANQSYPISFGDLRIAGGVPSILRDSWIGSQAGGATVHPTFAAGHTVTNVVEYSNPTTPSAGYGKAGISSNTGGGTESNPNPSPKPLPVVVDINRPAIQLTMAQSEPALVTKSNILQDPRPTVKAENFYFIGYDGVASVTGPLISKKLTEANKNQFNTGLVFLANALAYAVPGKQFVLAAANEQGTSRVNLYNDGTWGDKYNADGTMSSQDKNRTWEDFKMVVDEVYRLHPEGPTRLSSYWWGADIGLTSQFLAEFAPFYYRQTAGGQPFTLGAKHGYRQQTMDHSIYDFNTSDPSQKGQGIIPRTVPMDMGKCLGFPGVDASRRAGVQTFIDDERFQSLGGLHGFTPYSYINDDGAHPHKTDPWGYAEGAYQFYMPTFLAAAGINIQPPKFLGVYTSSDGLTAEVKFHAPNGGVLSNNHRIRGGTLNTSSLGFQEIYGLEVKRASGGGRYPIVRPSASGAGSIDPKYHGTVTIKDGKTAKIAMVQALQPGDEISYQRKQDSDYRTDYPSLWYNTNGHHLIAAIEHVSAYTDPSSSFPFAGFSLPVFSPSWKIVRGGYVGEGTPAGGSTPVVEPR